jgi:hypothetical protein
VCLQSEDIGQMQVNTSLPNHVAYVVVLILKLLTRYDILVKALILTIKSFCKNMAYEISSLYFKNRAVNSL